MNNAEQAASTPDNEEAKFSLVPADFPQPVHIGAIAGVQPKVLTVEYKGQFYPAGGIPPERYERWDICEDLARQIAQKSLASKAGKRAHMSEREILDQYLTRLIKTRWTSQPEARWIIRRTAAKLNWPAPLGAIESDQ